jgi:hypothetical protein
MIQLSAESARTLFFLHGSDRMPCLALGIFIRVTLLTGRLFFLNVFLNYFTRRPNKLYNYQLSRYRSALDKIDAITTL